MGGSSKLLLPLGDETMLSKAAWAALEYCDPVIVVTGKDESLVQRGLEREILGQAIPGQNLDGEDLWRNNPLRERRFVFVHNPFWAQGRLSSLRAGIKVLKNNPEGFFLAHADMPFVDPGVYRKLSETARARKAAGFAPAMIFPSMGGKKGHPVFFPLAFAPAIKAASEPESLKEAVSSLEQISVEIPCEGIFEDIDSPEDYERLCHKYGLAGGGLRKEIEP
jgi:molybdenum cofactor cytidylyltransferase